MTKLLRDPLIHFIALGAILFAAHGLYERAVLKSDYTIYVSAEEIQRQAAIFATENQRQPSDEDIQGLLFAHVEEQILMREAERLGLSDNDTIIRRRLAQKMRFMLNDETPPNPDNEDVLRDWFDERKTEFVRPARRAFTHIYFSPGEHDDVAAIANESLSKVTDSNWKTIGDPFIEQSQFGLIDEQALVRKMGYNFAGKIFELPQTGAWQGPVESSFGLHLVRIDKAEDEAAPEFEDIRGEVLARWQEEALRDKNQTRLEQLLIKYKIDVEEPS